MCSVPWLRKDHMVEEKRKMKGQVWGVFFTPLKSSATDYMGFFVLFLISNVFLS